VLRAGRIDRQISNLWRQAVIQSLGNFLSGNTDLRSVGSGI
jgi:hypothetical protein